MKVLDKINDVKLDVKLEEKPGFYMWYEEGIEESVKEKIDNFVNAIYNDYKVLTPVYINVFDKDYVTYEGDDEEQGYIINWGDANNYPIIDDVNIVPEIILPAKIGKWEIEDVMYSLAEAIIIYFAWCLNMIDDNFSIEEEEIDFLVDKFIK